MNSSKMRTPVLALLVLAAVGLSGCAGVRVGPGTTTGAVVGGAASIINHDGGRAAVIGTGIGAAVDILTGQPPVEVEDPYYRAPRVYREDPYYRGPVYREPPRVYRRLPPPPPRHELRRIYDYRCGCYVWR